MRKLISLSIIAVFACGVAYAYPDPSLSGWDNKSKSAQQVAGKGGTQQATVLKWVRYADQAQNGPSLVSGDAVVYSTVSDDGISVVLSTTSADGAIAGIVQVTIQTADNAQNSPFDGYGRRNWGWILVHGKTVANITAAGAEDAAVGDAFITSTDAGKITSYQTAPAAYLNGAYFRDGVKKNGRGGFFLDDPAVTDTTVEVQVNLE